MDVARRLALGRLVSLSGGSAAYIALVAAIYGQTEALWISAAIFSSVVASLASAPSAGWIGDRFDRRRVLIDSDVAAAAVSLAMTATADRRGGACRPARSLVNRAIPLRAGVGAALPTVVPKKELVRRWFARPRVPLPRSEAAHAFRHTWRLQLVGRREAVNVVHALLGHASLSSTQIYIRAAGHHVRDAAHIRCRFVASYGDPAGHDIRQTTHLQLSPARVRNGIRGLGHTHVLGGSATRGRAWPRPHVLGRCRDRR